mgnify:CR=1 FL=1
MRGGGAGLAEGFGGKKNGQFIAQRLEGERAAAPLKACLFEVFVLEAIPQIMMTRIPKRLIVNDLCRFLAFFFEHLVEAALAKGMGQVKLRLGLVGVEFGLHEPIPERVEQPRHAVAELFFVVFFSGENGLPDHFFLEEPSRRAGVGQPFFEVNKQFFDCLPFLEKWAANEVAEAAPIGRDKCF